MSKKLTKDGWVDSRHETPGQIFFRRASIAGIIAAGIAWSVIEAIAYIRMAFGI